jgi:hypothetical protein
MNNLKEKTIGKYVYLISNEINELSEGAAVLYSNTILGFASFVDNQNKECNIHYGDGVYGVKFNELEVVVASSNPNDGTQMLFEFKTR